MEKVDSLSQDLGSKLVVVLVFSVVLSSPFLYTVSSLASRFALIAAFLAVLISTTLASYWNKERTALSMLIIASLLFLLWRSSFVMPHYVEGVLNSRHYIFAEQYREEGHLVFGEAHSYFFLPSLILDLLWIVCGISALESIYISILICWVFTALTGFLILKVIKLHTPSEEKSRSSGAVLAPLIVFCLVSSAYSERVSPAELEQVPLLLLLLVMCILFNRGLRSRSDAVIVLLLVVGITLGSTDGILMLTPFFFLFSILSRTRSASVYALLPVGYMLHAGYQYTISLRTYAIHGWEGFWEFLEKIISGQPWERAIPWQRTISPTREDAVVTSVGYLSLILLSLIAAFTLTLLLIREHGKHENDNPDMPACLWSNLTCLWLALAVAAITYIGASIKPEVSFSDIRTIAIVFVSWLLPFMFISQRLIANISRRKALVALVITLTILASLRTIYQVYPKSVHDPINAVEDERLGSTAVYAAGGYINTYYRTGGIVADYKVSNRLGMVFSSLEYERRWLDENTLADLFDRSSERTILIFNVAGTKYPSIYHPSEAYMAAYSFTMKHNRIYDNGAVLVSSQYLTK